MDTGFKRSAWVLSLAGILPFIAPVFWLYFANEDQGLIERAQLYIVTYGAIILSFLGGVRWGVAIHNNNTTHLLWSVVPSLIAWACLLAPTLYQLPALTFGFFFQWLWDYQSTRQNIMQSWFGRLRSFISICVIALFILSIFAFYRA